ncbi:putative ABC transport system permease protein [Paenibacillus sp. UNCCL117]|uniref:ABC transporter permease n=1 Tax=unclassified Paenibacillus TaxID=185978 RepID=UPI00088C8C0A|nr:MULTISPECIES: ABC transporter permease [unclassified Paenibacillus]SDC53316.1 putative ABC transport system permease protein [Paenibacillus sp. cl123]SFW11190.1 putative ABC transport system permease protein [Paenibacillus sp. UNCCL117]
MRAGELIAMALKTVTASWMRTLLTMLGVIIGVASVVTLVSIGRGTTAAIEKQFENLGTNLITVNILGQGRANSLDYEEVMQFEEFPEFNYLAPAVTGGNMNVKYDRTQDTYSVLGTNDRYFSITKTELASGRLMSESDISFRTNVAVLGSTVATELFESANPIDKIINIKGYEFKVIGVLKTKGATMGMSVDESIIVPITTGQRQLALGNIRTTYIEAKSKEQMALAQTTFSNYLTTKYKSANGFRILNQDSLVESRTAATSSLTSQLVSVACISLLVGGIGIMNIMLVTVTERTREIGIRKSIGAKRRNILAQFLVEAVVISGLGGLLGLILGIGISLAWPYLNKNQLTVISWDISFYAFLFSVAVGIIFGLYPANKASKLRPIDALRTD